jgi:carotenoid 1,2-hydratase
MPTIPLYACDGAADAWHRVTSPGGYEWWYFDAEDAEHDRQIVAILFQGFVFHPGYLRAYWRYRRRPTRVAPPLPAQFPCAYFVVYERGRIAHQFMTQYPSSAFVARSDAPQVAVGPNTMTPDGAALRLKLTGTPWKLTFHGPVLLEDQTLEAEFAFRPHLSAPPQQRTFLSRQLSGADHHWVIANPLCDVTGTIRCVGQAIEFRGRGYHDHNYGTAPLGAGLKRWIWGRVLFDDLACTFHFARPRDRGLADEVHLIEADATGVREVPIAAVEGDWSRRTAGLLCYPPQLRFENALWLSNGRVIDSSPFYLRLMYDARHDDRHGRAFCEIAYPHRLRWPVLGRMIEMSIDRRGV